MQPERQETIKKIQPSPKFLRIFFFLSGIIATIAYRIILFFDPFWVKVIWYVGTIGFIIYFGHRSHIENKRAKLVKEYDLVNGVEKSGIDEDRKLVLSYLIKTSLTSKARFNSAFIFIVSVIALVVSAGVDIYHIVF